MKINTIQLVGMWTDDPYANEKFNKVADAIRFLGFKVINPVDICSEQLPWVANLSLCMESIVNEADAIFLIENPCDTDSYGAKIEFLTARKYHKVIYDSFAEVVRESIMADKETGNGV